MTMSEVPTSMPTPMLDIKRSCDCDRVNDSGRAPARNDLGSNVSLDHQDRARVLPQRHISVLSIQK